MLIRSDFQLIHLHCIVIEKILTFKDETENILSTGLLLKKGNRHFSIINPYCKIGYLSNARYKVVMLMYVRYLKFSENSTTNEQNVFSLVQL